MSSNHGHSRKSPFRILFEYSLFLVFGAIAALVWANVSYDTHHTLFHTDLIALAKGESGDAHGDSHADEGHDEGHDEDHSGDKHADEDHAGDNDADDKAAAATESADNSDGNGEHAKADGTGVAADSAAHEEDHGDHAHPFNLYFIINDILMAFFFAIAGKEVWESMLPGGALSNPKKAATPLLATAGGIIGPAVIYVGGVLLFSNLETLGRGWAIPCATDIAFSYLVARLIFGNGHPAIAFLLLLAIADDAAGLMIIALFYSSGLKPIWLLLTVGAIALGFVFQKVLKLHSFWWYLLIPGSLSWFSFFQAGIHPALGLVPIIPCLPHAHTDLGIFAREELNRHDTLNEFEHWWKNPVEVFLGLFGLCNAAVRFESAGTATWLVLSGLLLGKPLGITAFTWFAEKGLRLEIPKGMRYKEIFTLGCIAAIGFTVALFVSAVAFPVPPASQSTLDAAKMGALASFGAAVISVVVAWILGVKKWKPGEGFGNPGDGSGVGDAGHAAAGEGQTSLASSAESSETAESPSSQMNSTATMP